VLRLRGAWRQAERPDIARVSAALAPLGADLVDVIGVEPGELRLLIRIPETADVIVIGEAVADVLALPSPKITFHQDSSSNRGAAGQGYYCSCGGVDGDHVEGCPRAVR
jgi:hypothetical protein